MDDLVFASATEMAAVVRAREVTSAELVELDHEPGRLAAGHLADVNAVPGNPVAEHTVTQDVRFVMKAGRVYTPVTSR